MAVNQLHFHIMEKLQGIKELLAYESDDKLAMAEELADAVVSSVTIDSLVIGVLEEAFFEMVGLCHVGCWTSIKRPPSFEQVIKVLK